MLAGREVFPKIPWKRTFCWRDHLLNLCLSECLLQNSISLHLEIGKKKWQKCSLYQQSSLLHTSTPKYPFLAGEEFSSFCKSPRCQLYRCKNLLKRVVRITQIQSESWLEAKENSFALLIFFFFNLSTSVHYQNISIATETPTGIYKDKGEAGCEICRVPAQFTVIQNGSGHSQWRWMISNTRSFCQILIWHVFPFT